MENSGLDSGRCHRLTKTAKYIILNRRLNMLFAPRRISLRASGGVIYFMGGEHAD